MMYQLAAVTGPHEAEPTLLGLGAEGWVYTGVTIFFLLAIFVGKAHRKLLDGLDAKIAETRKTLDEAAEIRAEAELLLAAARQQQAASAGDAKKLIDHAREEAATIVSKAESDATELVKRRERMAQDKIAAAELAAVETLRGRTAELATAAARDAIVQSHGAKADKPLVDQAIAGI
ncbi:MAG: hypothetical protein P0Y56_03145 [Candidatus Andeanibacterium colombiense]|uniref:ATP synthase subunit b n=1 Tax=Candidatus Andeanibacterium colombiense TaxID=3121345 RepID=A0AAJ5X788_9SPHN|nr:MAG: hypothetical protein P0Y56_03145 [Sphingomonadaceae bacterium]